MAALNLVKHLNRLVRRRDRLTRETASKQRQLDAVLSQLAKIHAALPVDAKPVADVLIPDAWKPFARAEGGVL